MEQPTYYHSVMLEREKCKGCTTCLKHCPTEAIRVYGGSAHIIKERCIDCGECIRVCTNLAKQAVSDGFEVELRLIPDGKKTYFKDYKLQ